MVKHITGFCKKRKFIYLLIAFTVVFFNLIAIFGIDILLHDDHSWYTNVLEGKFQFWRLKHNLLDPFMEWAAWTIMAYSPPLARGLIVLIFMVPISCCFYYIFHVKLEIPRVTAFTAAIIPHILPYQWQIPAGINMSYPVWGFLFSILSLILGWHYLEKTTPGNRTRLFGAIMCFFIASQLMEQSLFLFPPLVLAFFAYTRLNKKHLWLISSFFIVAAAKFIQVTLFPRKELYDISTGEIIERIGLYFKWSLPLPDINPVTIAIICPGIMMTGFLLYLKHPSMQSRFGKNFSHLGKKGYTLFFYAFFICWCVSTIFVFICMSKPYTPRYTYMSAFGLNVLFMVSIYAILRKLFPGNHRLPIFVFISIIIFSGLYRYLNLKAFFTPINNTHKIIVKEVNKREFPLNSQVVISGVKGIDGGWRRASGYFKYALKRKDVNGLIGQINSSEYYNFDNHFDPGVRGWSKRYYMTGLSIDKPVFFFLMDRKKKELKQLEYALQWKGKTKNAYWTILHANKTTGVISIFISGTGMEEYLSTIKKLGKKGISQSDILWGGPPTKKELERLEQVESEPIHFQPGFYEPPLEFKKIKPNQAEHILFISKTVEPFANDIYVGDKFLLMLAVSNESARENGKTGEFKFIHLLWKSLKKQKIKKHALAITLEKNHRNVWGRWPKFCSSGTELNPGDYIFGYVKIPVGKFKKADHLGIRLSEVPGPPQWISLKIQGNHKTDQGGFRVLIPVDKSRPE